MKFEEEKKTYKIFLLSSILTSALILSGIFLVLHIFIRDIIREENLVKARSLFNLITLARKWNAGYGGVYVEKKEGVESNPYLENPDIKTLDGRTFTLRNPAMMTREISKYAEREGLFRFRIARPNPLNPLNEPDSFELRAIDLLLNGNKEVHKTENIEGKLHFRYVAPILVEKGCLNCHADFNLGDIRNVISISFSIEDTYNKLKRNSIFIVLSAFFTILFLSLSIYFFTIRLMKKLSEARKEIEKMAITDGLTGIFNRKYLMTRLMEEYKRAKRLREELSVILLDIDHFKTINDEYGHLIGDEVLKNVAERIKGCVRVYDIVGRYGGEEFLVILPGTGFEGAKNVAERIRACVKETHICNVQVAVSLGIASIHEDDQSEYDLLKRADDGLYKAKTCGRDRVEWVCPAPV